nr:endonuclease/exonuclease/phosphatase family protein [uncultured Bdellovibrio sp.]
MGISKLLVLGTLLFSTHAKAEQYWQADPRPPRFCVQNFNAYGPIYAKNIEGRTERIAGFLQGIPKCDVVHLQEVWNDSHIVQFEKSLKHQYNISAPNKDEKIGLMSFFMGDIKGRQTVDFNVNNEGGVLDSVRSAFNVKKAYHIVRSNFFGIDEDFFFMNTHLHPTSKAVRITQILDILQWRLKHQQLKLVFSGDFNSDIDSVERKFLMKTLGAHDSMEEYLGQYPKGYCTYCFGNPLGWMLSDHTFDYIFFSNVGESGTTLKATEGQVNMRGSPREPWSDHYGVRVELSVEPETSQITEKALEVRRTDTIEMLAVAEYILKEERGDEFKPYITLVQQLSGQLKNRTGDFNSYFEKFR